MKSVHVFLFSAVLALSSLTFRPMAASGDDYWTNHWNWYDNTYRPYYYRNYPYSGGGYYAPAYSGYSSPGVYSPGYAPGYGGYGYGYTPYRNYYGTPGVGYGRMYGGGSAVNIGGMTFGWR